MRFYGMSLKEVRELTSEEDEMLWQAITVIEAQDALVSLKISAFPHMKKQDAEKLHRSLHRQAYPTNYENQRSITIEDMAALING